MNKHTPLKHASTCFLSGIGNHCNACVRSRFRRATACAFYNYLVEFAGMRVINISTPYSAGNRQFLFYLLVVNNIIIYDI